MSTGDMHWTDLVAQARELDSTTPVVEIDDVQGEGARYELTLSACETFYGHGFSDGNLGDIDTFGHHYRVSRWTVETDSSGNRELTEHGSEEEATAWWATLEDEYSAWLEQE